MSVNVRVEQRYVPSGHMDRMRAIVSLLRQLKREMNNAGIAPLMKRYEAYEKPCERRRRKERSAELAKLFAQQEQDPTQQKKKTKRVAKQARKTFGGRA